MLIAPNNTFMQDHLISETFSNHFHGDERQIVQQILENIKLTPDNIRHIQTEATRLIANVRATRLKRGGIDALMMQYDLSNEEGVALMCLAEALLRVPDNHTAEKLIRDKIDDGNWDNHLGSSHSIFVNSATWGLMLAGKLLKDEDLKENNLRTITRRMISKHSEPVIHKAMRHGMRIIGKQFVKGQTINEALKRSKPQEKQGYTFSYDMLGEAARTDTDAQHYQAAYADAIESIGKNAKNKGVYKSPGISVKLSAILARYELAQHERVFNELYPRLLTLCEAAKKWDIGLTIDAEESERLEISLAVIKKLAHDPALAGWQGLGMAVQAYQKRAPLVIDFLINLGRASQKRFKVRLVKGAYWDSEIKHAQEAGMIDFPVFTRKVYTDLCYMYCAEKMLANPTEIYSQFATHNAFSFATILEIAGNYTDFEFQCLHGMGDTLYNQVVNKDTGIPCRIYAPVGSHKHLLAYLVRRLLENGANSSFVNRIVNECVPIEDLVQCPITMAKRLAGKPHPHILAPLDMFPDRKNARGFDNFSMHSLIGLAKQLDTFAQKTYIAKPTLQRTDKPLPTAENVRNPADLSQIVGTVYPTCLDMIDEAFEQAYMSFEHWHRTPATVRAQCLLKMADLLESHMAEFIYLAIREAGKTLSNAVAEVREAVDFCRYYAVECEKHFAMPEVLPGPTGEMNSLALMGRGVFVCISPWNFPLAIFLGEVTAALAAGNTVIAKPAPQTPLIAARAVELLHEAGVPKSVVTLLPGNGEIGAACIAHPHCNGVIFTGSTGTAKAIQKSLMENHQDIIPLIAETGGQNAMIVDSSALPEQVVADVIQSAFDSAGQRCSALRVLFIQSDVADGIITMLKGAMDELSVGDPSLLSTDVGPVIDKDAKIRLEQHITDLSHEHPVLNQVPGQNTGSGTFVLPTLFEIPHISALKHEVFGPICHVIRFEAEALDDVIDQINSTGFGLTFGVHSRIEDTVRYIVEKVKAGNCYVNRNTVGAIVGVQPFGGQGLSGTGPKAGGPWYLPRLAVEKTISVNTTAAGGNTTLMSISDIDDDTLDTL